MVAVVMFLMGFFQSILGIIGRMPAMFWFGLLLMLCMFLEFLKRHKWLRMIPTALCGAYCGMNLYWSSVYGADGYRYFSLNALMGALLCVFLLVSLLPDKRKK